MIAGAFREEVENPDSLRASQRREKTLRLFGWHSLGELSSLTAAFGLALVDMDASTIGSDENGAAQSAIDAAHHILYHHADVLAESFSVGAHSLAKPFDLLLELRTYWAGFLSVLP
jgi:hypothetical protein